MISVLHFHPQPSGYPEGQREAAQNYDAAGDDLAHSHSLRSYELRMTRFDPHDGARKRERKHEPDYEPDGESSKSRDEIQFITFPQVMSDE